MGNGKGKFFAFISADGADGRSVLGDANNQVQQKLLVCCHETREFVGIKLRHRNAVCLQIG